MLMFHSLVEGTPSHKTEWRQSDFEQVIDDIKKQGIKVVTLSELDKENGIPETRFTVHDFTPAQINLDISAIH